MANKQRVVANKQQLSDDTRSKWWCFTINNYRSNYLDLDGLKNWVYLIVGKEKGEEGTKHLQGFIVFKTRIRFSTIKKQIPRAHIERCFGKPSENILYCQKDGRWEAFGTEPKDEDFTGGASGGRKKAVNYREIIRLSEEHKFDELKEQHPSEYFRHYGTIKRIAMDNPKPVQTIDKLENEWIWGATGLGKSSAARMENPGWYDKTHSKQWNGYKGEEVVLIDDLGKNAATWIGDFLKLWADHYPFPADVKYSQDLIRPRKIVVTSNYSIDELFGHDETLCEALKRRFKSRHIINPFPHVLVYQQGGLQYPQ